MSYEPTTWKTGDVLNATALNKILNGISEIDNAVTTLASTTVSNLASTVTNLVNTIPTFATTADLASTVNSLINSYPQYDIIIASTTNLASTVVNDYLKIKWNYSDIKQKVSEGKLVTGILYNYYNYDDEFEGNTSQIWMPLQQIDIFGEFGLLFFIYNIIQYNGSNSISIKYMRNRIRFYTETGEFYSVELAVYGSKNVS